MEGRWMGWSVDHLFQHLEEAGGTDEPTILDPGSLERMRDRLYVSYVRLGDLLQMSYVPRAHEELSTINRKNS